MKILIIFFLLALSSLRLYAPAPQPIKMPWWPTDSSFNVYSDLLPAGEKQTIHYIFVESKGDKAKDPLILWLNGGPGCSSMLGFISEIGPYLWEDGSSNFSQIYNKYSWNQNANILFFESPPGVGFSENNKTDYVWSDENTTLNNYNALSEWFKVFPEYQKNDFWITGESYAGIYIPFLANEIDTRNAQQNVTLKINLKGIMVGNGITTFETSNYNYTSLTDDMLKFYIKHMMLSPQLSNILLNICPSDYNSATCVAAQQEVNRILPLVNIYDIYGYCYEGTSVSPCIFGKPISDYLNTAEIKNALNVNQLINWKSCSDEVFQNYNRDPRGSFWIYKNLIKKYRILIYSGDTDSRVPYTYTQNWIAQLNLKGVKSWRPWYISQNQIGGYAEVYDGLTFVTIRGAGHMVPQWRKEAGYKMFSCFLNNEDF